MSEDIKLRLQVVCRLGSVRVLEQNKGQARRFVNRLVSLLGCTSLVPESQPAVGGVQETRFSASFDRAFSLESSDIVAFTSDTGNDGNTVIDRLDESLDDLNLLLFGEECTLARVAENDETFDTFDRTEPGSDTLNGLKVDRAVLVEGLCLSVREMSFQR